MWTTRGQDGGLRAPDVSAIGTRARALPLAAHREHLDPGQTRRRLGPEVRVAIVANPPDGGDRVAQVLVGRLWVADHRTKVVPLPGEQARIEATFGRQARPGAIAAERRGHRGDEPDLAATIAIAPARRDFSAVARRHGLERHVGVD